MGGGGGGEGVVEPPTKFSYQIFKKWGFAGFEFSERVAGNEESDVFRGEEAEWVGKLKSEIFSNKKSL